MPVVMYLGLPGDGKSMSGVRRLIDELVKGTRCIITNLPMELGELSAYLQREYGQDFDCMRRVILMTQEQVRKFWLIRPDGWRLLDIADEAYKQNVFPDLTTVFRWVPGTAVDDSERVDLATLDRVHVELLVNRGCVERGAASGCLYIIDEAQNFWPARSYASTPPGLLFYLSQHRHCGDDCVFITQKESQVEKTIRNLVAEYYVFRDLGKRRRLGFRLPSVFGYSCFNEPPSGHGAQFVSFGTFRMDKKGLAACYRTADGVGVGGPTQSADVGHRKAGKSWVWAAAIVVLLLGVLVMTPSTTARLLSKALVGPQPGSPTNAHTGGVIVAPPPAPVQPAPNLIVKEIPRVLKAAVVPALATSGRTNRWLVACVESHDKSNVVVRTSDGFTYDETSLEAVKRDRWGRVCRVMIRGEWIEWTP